MWTLTWLRNFRAHLPHERTGNGEGGRDPAVGVDDVDGHVIVIDTLNGAANILGGSNQQRKGDQQHCGEDVVEAEDDIVCYNILSAKVFFQSSQEHIHFAMI